jgi:hypothetical protein
MVNEIEFKYIQPGKPTQNALIAAVELNDSINPTVRVYWMPIYLKP